MKQNYPTYDFKEEDVREGIARFTRLSYPKNHPFDSHHGHKFHQVIGFLDGGGRHNINFKAHEIQNNSLHILAARDLHLLERGKGSTGFVVAFKKRFLHKLEFVNPEANYHGLFSQSQVINLDQKQSEAFRYITREMLENEADDRYMLNLIGAFLTKMAVSFQPPLEASPSYDSLAIELIELINRHFKEQLSTDQYAELLHTTSGNLQKKAKKFTNSSPRQLQQDRLLNEAKKLLCRPDANVSEIADELGFKETAHFSNWFKKNTGETPSQYKG